jgi:hypothetical protein
MVMDTDGGLGDALFEVTGFGATEVLFAPPHAARRAVTARPAKTRCFIIPPSAWSASLFYAVPRERAMGFDAFDGAIRVWSG